MTNTNKTLINNYVHTLIDTTCGMGVEREKLLEPFASEIIDLEKPGKRVDLSFMTRLFKRAVTLSGDKDLGLHVGENFRPGTLHVVAPLLMNCTTLDEAFQVLVRYHTLVSEGGTLSSRRTKEGVDVVYKPSPMTIPMTRYQIEGIFAGFVTFTRWMLNYNLSLEKVCFEHEINFAPIEYERIFACPVYFGKGENLISIYKDDLNLLIPQADPNLQHHHQSIADQLLWDLKKNNKISHYLKQWLNEQKNPGKITLETAASYLKMSKRTLQRHIQSEGTSFISIHEEVMVEKAKQLLITTENPISEIAFKLGYLNTSSFYRAFKKWNGVTPKKYRDSGDH
jgi:AraC-like DNA-binding protein